MSAFRPPRSARWLLLSLLVGAPAAAEVGARLEFDSNGHPSRFVAPSGVELELSFDVNGRLRSLASGDRRATYERGRDGELLSVRDPWGETRFDYADDGRSASVTLGGARPRRLRYEFDSYGRTKRLAIESSGSTEAFVEYDLDSLGRPHQVRVGARAGDPQTIRLAYDPSNGKVVRTLPDGTRSTFTLGADGRLVDVHHESADGDTIARSALEYTPGRRVRELRITSPSYERRLRYDYDRAGRLVELRDGDNVSTLRYDATGRIAAVTTGGRRHDVQYDDLSRITGVGPFSVLRNGSELEVIGPGVQAGLRSPGPFEYVSRWQGETTRLRYDGLGGVVSVKQGDRQEFRTIPDLHEGGHLPLGSYEAGGRLLSFRPPLGSLGLDLDVTTKRIRFELESLDPTRRLHLASSRPRWVEMRQLPRPVRLAGIARAHRPGRHVRIEPPRYTPLTLRDQLRSVGGNLSRRAERLIELGNRLPRSGPELDEDALRAIEPRYYKFIDSLDQTLALDPGEFLKAQAAATVFAGIQIVGRPATGMLHAFGRDLRSQVAGAVASGLIQRFEGVPASYLIAKDPVAFLPLAQMSDAAGEFVATMEQFAQLVSIGKAVRKRSVLPFLEDQAVGYATGEVESAFAGKRITVDYALRQHDGKVDLLLGGVSARGPALERDAARYLGSGSHGVAVNSGWLLPFDAVQATLDHVFGGHLTQTDEILWRKLEAAGEIGTIVFHSHGVVVARNLREKLDRALRTGSLEIDRVILAGADPGDLAEMFRSHGVDVSVRIDPRDPIPVLTTTWNELSAKAGTALGCTGVARACGDVGAFLWKLGAIGWMLLPGGPYDLDPHGLENLLGGPPSPSPVEMALEQKQTQLGGIQTGGRVRFEGELGPIAGAVYDRDLDRLVLLVDEDATLPGVRADHLAVAFKAVFSGRGIDLKFSLDPWDPKNPDGRYLRLRYYPDALLRGTDFGRVMFEADYRMKQIAMAVLYEDGSLVRERPRVAGVVSDVDLAFVAGLCPGYVPRAGSTRARMYITQDEITLQRRNSEILFAKVKLKVEPRSQDFGPDGTLTDLPVTDPDAKCFARRFGDHYDELAARYPSLAALKETYKAMALARWLRDQGIRVDLSGLPVPRTPSSSTRRADAIWVEHTRDSWRRTAPPAYRGRDTGIGMVQISGGIDMTVRPRFEPAGRELDVVAARTREALRRADDQPVLTIEGTSRGFRGLVVPTSSRTRALWSGERSYVRDGVTYRMGADHRFTEASGTRGNESFHYDEEGRLRALDFEDESGRRVRLAREDGGTSLELREDDENLELGFDEAGTLVRVSDGEEVLLRASKEGGGLRISYADGVTESIAPLEGGGLEVRARVAGGTGTAPVRVRATADPPEAAVSVEDLTISARARAGGQVQIEMPTRRFDVRFEDSRLTSARLGRDGRLDVEYDGDAVRSVELERGHASSRLDLSQGRPTRFRAFEGETETYAYDASGRLREVAGPLGVSATFSYSGDDAGIRYSGGSCLGVVERDESGRRSLELRLQSCPD